MSESIEGITGALRCRRAQIRQFDTAFPVGEAFTAANPATRFASTRSGRSLPSFQASSTPSLGFDDDHFQNLNATRKQLGLS